MNVGELIGKVKASLEARTVYAEPYEKDGITVIPAARIVGGGGGGAGRDEKGQLGDGAGFGLIARPAGAYVIKDGQVSWEPALDVHRLPQLIAVIIVTALLVFGRIVRLRAEATAPPGDAG